MFTAEKCPTRHTSQCMALGHGREYMWTLPHLSVHGPGPWQRVHVDFAALLSTWPWAMAESTCGLCCTSQSMALGHPAMAEYMWTLPHFSVHGPGPSGHGREYMMTLPKITERYSWLWQIVTPIGLRSSF